MNQQDTVFDCQAWIRDLAHENAELTAQISIARKALAEARAKIAALEDTIRANIGIATIRLKMQHKVTPEVVLPTFPCYLDDDGGVVHRGGCGQCRAAEKWKVMYRPAKPALDSIGSIGGDGCCYCGAKDGEAHSRDCQRTTLSAPQQDYYQAPTIEPEPEPEKTWRDRPPML